MKTSQRGLDLIKFYEGLELEAYLDAVDIWTIGYGHTSRAGPPDVTPGMVITELEAEDILRNDLRKFEADVSGAVRVDISQNMFDALVSITYNIGPTNMRGSTFLRLLNQEDYEGAADAMLMWVKAGGQVLRGLQLRRAAERELFLEGYEPDQEIEPQDVRGLPVEEDAQRRENLLTSRTMGGAAATGGAGAAAIGATMLGDEEQEEAGDDSETDGGDAPVDDAAPTDSNSETDGNNESADEMASADGDDVVGENDNGAAEDTDSDTNTEESDAEAAIGEEGGDDEADATDDAVDPVTGDDEGSSTETTDEATDDSSSEDAAGGDVPAETEDEAGVLEDDNSEGPADEVQDDSSNEPAADDADDEDGESDSPTDDGELVEGTEQHDGPLFVSAFEGGEATDAVVIGAGTVAVLSAIWVAAVRFDDWRNHRR